MPNSTKRSLLCNTCESIFADGSYEWWAKWHKEHADDSDESQPKTRTFASLLTQGYPIQHHPSYESFSKSLAQGCWICVQLEDFAYPKPQSSNFEALFYQLAEWPQTGGDPAPKPHYRLSFQLGGSNFYFVVEAVRPWTRLHSLAESSKLQAWTGDQGTAELAKGWLELCQKQHRSCSKHVVLGWYPTRLLDVSDNLIRLRRSLDDQVSGPYATLSHCWGTKRFWVLCTETLPELTEGVPLKSFPNTFQQAVTTTRRLGIRYLWIDCYCILQGSDINAQADWEFEASRMGQVYSNALINIGAAQAAGPDHGLFSTRSTRDIKRIAIHWRPFPGNTMEGYSLTVPGIEFSFDQVWHRLHGSPLAGRGWVIQESVLCPRMLTFNGPEIIWQCYELAASGDFPINNTNVYSPTSYPFWALIEFDSPLRSSKVRWIHKGHKVQLLEQWAWLMVGYRAASFTYPDKDAFKALDGVGQRVAQLTGDVYQHGMLGMSFPQALLWSARHVDCRPSPPHRAPNWHWASYEGDQTFQMERDLSAMRSTERGSPYLTPLIYPFMSDDCQTLSSSTATDLWPSLMCIGRLCMLKMKEDAQEILRQYEGAEGVQIRIALDGDQKASNEIDIMRDPGFEENPSLEGLSLLPLVSAHRVFDAKWKASTGQRVMVSAIHGLVLRRRQKGTFQRIGTFKDRSAFLLGRLQVIEPRLIELD